MDVGTPRARGLQVIQGPGARGQSVRGEHPQPRLELRWPRRWPLGRHPALCKAVFREPVPGCTLGTPFRPAAP